jgi:hypothetical protein
MATPTPTGSGKVSLWVVSEVAFLTVVVIVVAVAVVGVDLLVLDVVECRPGGVLWVDGLEPVDGEELVDGERLMVLHLEVEVTRAVVVAAEVTMEGVEVEAVETGGS